MLEGGGGGGGTTRLRFGAGVFDVFAGVGASEPGGVWSFVTGRPTWSRETT